MLLSSIVIRAPTKINFHIGFFYRPAIAARQFDLVFIMIIRFFLLSFFFFFFFDHLRVVKKKRCEAAATAAAKMMIWQILLKYSHHIDMNNTHTLKCQITIKGGSFFLFCIFWNCVRCKVCRTVGIKYFRGVMVSTLIAFHISTLYEISVFRGYFRRRYNLIIIII